MQYKTELHAHSKDISPCSNSSVETIVEKYTAAGYDSIVLTNHFNYETLENKFPGASWDVKVNGFTAACRKLAEAAEGSGLHVILGAEIRFLENSNDYLLFGDIADFLMEVPEIFTMGIAKYSELVRSRGILIFQAHPFRFGITMTNPKYVDGIEVYNGHPGHNSNNDIAEAWADKYGLLKSAGTDYHDVTHNPVTGIMTDFPVRDSETLMKVLGNRDFSIIR